MLIEGFYKILEFEHSDDQISASILLNIDHDVYKGHFPGQPVVPGVVQLQMIKEMVEKSLNHVLLISEVSFVKYLTMIDPVKEAELCFDITILPLDSDQYKIQARIYRREIVFTKLKGIFRKN